ncbi:MAG: insulinase family protein [Acidobacteriia bacterium]|nr:insulinase family protein [Terriglobia bacterium]
MSHFILHVRVLASSVNDSPGLPGVAEATAKLLVGDNDALKQDLEDYGATLETSVSYGSYTTEFSVSGPVEAFDYAAGKLFHALTRPAFTAKNLAEWKLRRTAKLQDQKSSPNYLADSVLAHLLYEDARENTGPDDESLQRMTVADLQKFYQTYYSPCRTSAGVISPVPASGVESRLQKLFSSWKGCAAADAVKTVDRPLAGKSVHLVDDPQMKQAYLVLGKPAVSRLSLDYAACLVLNRILGEGPGSRLWPIRQTKGYTYDIHSSLTALKYLHHISITAALAPERVHDVLGLITAEVEALRTSGPTREEVEAAKEAIVGGLALDLENRDVILGTVMNQYLYGWAAGHEQQYVLELLAINPRRVQQAAQKYLDTNQMQIIVIGNKKVLGPLLGRGSSLPVNALFTKRANEIK